MSTSIGFAAHATASGRRAYKIVHNAAGTTPSEIAYAHVLVSGAAGGPTVQVITGQVYCVAGDTLEVQGWQNAGTLAWDSSNAWLQLTRLFGS